MIELLMVMPPDAELIIQVEDYHYGEPDNYEYPVEPALRGDGLVCIGDISTTP